MPLNQLTVGAPSAASYGDGATPGQLGGKQGEAIVSHLHGRYYSQNVRGNLFYATTAAPGIAFTIFSATTAPTLVALAIWNPSTSGKNLSMVRASVGIAAVAATAASGWGYAWVGNAGSFVATLAVASVFTALTTRGSCNCGPPGQGSSVALASVAPTLTAALVWGRAAQFGSGTGVITTQTSPPPMTEDFEGTMVVPPGTIWCLTSSILSGITATASVIWEEVPI